MKSLIVSLLSVIVTAACAQQTDSIADKMLIYQLSNGGWPKQLKGGSVVNYDKPLIPELRELIRITDDKQATFDNKATSREINYLVKAHKRTQNKAYLAAAERGVDYILKAQYKNGGFPQFYPDLSSYRHQITYNDDAMVNVLNILQDIAEKKNDFEIITQDYVPKAKKAVDAGIDCILKTQVKQEGKRCIWGAQYDEQTLQPAKARAFEPASFSTSESVAIVRFLMRQPDPSAQIKEAIHAAVAWFEQYKIKDTRWESVRDQNNKIISRRLVKDDKSVVWARFYDLNRNVPIFGDRDNSIKYNVDELSEERRNGYAWYGNFAQKLLKNDYPKWKSQVKE